jgi:putative peptidoglycan lipid II flippase
MASAPNRADDSQGQMSQKFEHHARTVTVLTLLSRVSGLARDAALSRVFGVSALTDAFWFAFLIPNLFRRLFGEGALSAAFLPVYTRLDRDDPETARRLATLTIGMMVIVLGGVTLAGELALLALSTLAGGDHLALRLMMIMLPYMPLVCVVAILGAMLQVHGRFGPTAAAPVMLNLFIVVAAVGFRALDQTTHIAIVAGSVLLAGVLQVCWSLAALHRHDADRGWWTGLEVARGAWPHMQRVLRQAMPMFLGLGVLQINTFIDGVIASYPSTVGPTVFGRPVPLEPGANTALNNAQRLYEFPLGVFGIAVATAIFPALARAAGRGERPPGKGEQADDAFVDIFRRGLRLVVYIGLPASVGLILVRVPLTAAILQGRNFTADDTQRVAFVLLGYAPAIWAYSMTHVLTRAFYARGDAMTPVKTAVAMVALNFALNITLIWTPLKEAGLAWSTAIAAVVQVGILLRLTRPHAAHVVDREVRKSWLRSAIVSAVMGSVVWSIAHLILPPHELTWGWAVLQLALLVPAGAASVAIVSVLLKMPEMWWAMGKATPTEPT